MPVLKLFDAAALAGTLAAAAGSPRRRANLNLHPTLADPVQRLLNVFQPGTYVRPHRHEASRFELFLAVSGRVAIVTFDEAGEVAEAAVVGAGAAWAVELPGGTWHTVVSLAEDTALFEVKPGPYRPLAETDFAPWSPPEGTAAAAEMVRRWEALAGVASAPGR